MEATKRNLLIGMTGLALLLIGILAFAQVNAARNFDQVASPQSTP